MKKFALFAGNRYYPEGGICDFISDFSSLEEARKSVINEDGQPVYEWHQIIDTATFAVVERLGDSGP